MEAGLQRRIQRYGWDRAASSYESYWSRQLRPAQDRMLQLAALQPGEHVLDVACGTGLVTLEAAALVGGTGRVLGTDISAGMLEAAKLEAERRSFAHVEFARTDAEALDPAPGTFDAALCALGLMYFPDPVVALDRMRRALRPGGRVVVSVWGARERCGWAPIFPIVDARVQSDVCPMFFRLGTGDALSAAMQAAGFHGIRVDRISATLHYDSAEDACGAAFAGGPVALAYSRFDPEAREEAHAEYLTAIEPWRRQQRYELPGEFVVACGTA
jgi:ubiquinone/menaquinone biosynthesis C-methylase UbiE